MVDVQLIESNHSSNIYDEAASMLSSGRKKPEEVVEELIQKGLIREKACFVVETLRVQIDEAKRKKANKDLLFGLMWCGGGTILTVAHIGFIFWGAIVFGFAAKLPPPNVAPLKASLKGFPTG